MRSLRVYPYIGAHGWFVIKMVGSEPALGNVCCVAASSLCNCLRPTPPPPNTLFSFLPRKPTTDIQQSLLEAQRYEVCSNRARMKAQYRTPRLALPSMPPPVSRSVMLSARRNAALFSRAHPCSPIRAFTPILILLPPPPCLYRRHRCLQGLCASTPRC